MSNDLISRSALMDALRGNVLVDVTSELEDAISALPTAYNVDKVVGQLESEAERWEESGRAYEDQREIGVAEGYRKAIEIVIKERRDK